MMHCSNSGCSCRCVCVSVSVVILPHLDNDKKNSLVLFIVTFFLHPSPQAPSFLYPPKILPSYKFSTPPTPHSHPIFSPAYEVLFVRTDSRLALNIHGDCQPVANTKAARRASEESTPGLGSQAAGAGGQRRAPLGPLSPTTTSFPAHTGSEWKTRSKRPAHTQMPACTDEHECFAPSQLTSVVRWGTG